MLEGSWVGQTHTEMPSLPSRVSLLQEACQVSLASLPKRGHQRLPPRGLPFLPLDIRSVSPSGLALLPRLGVPVPSPLPSCPQHPPRPGPGMVSLPTPSPPAMPPRGPRGSVHNCRAQV